MRVAIVLLAAILSSPCGAQELSTSVDLSAIQAQIPPACENPPAPDTIVATAGTGTPCAPRADAARQTQVPPSTAVTASDGSFTGTWSATLPAVPTRGLAVINSGTIPFHCQIVTMSATGYTGKCWQLVSTTMPTLATALLGLVVSPFINASAGLTVNIFARY